MIQVYRLNALFSQIIVFESQRDKREVFLDVTVSVTYVFMALKPVDVSITRLKCKKPDIT